MTTTEKKRLTALACKVRMGAIQDIHSARSGYPGGSLSSAGLLTYLYFLATIKPLDEELVLKAARECGSVITCEEHSIIGGLGEAVCGLLSERRPTPVYRLGIQDSRSGCAEEPLKKFRLTAEHIVSAAEEALTRK